MTAKNVDVQMRHFLMSVAANIGEQAISGLDQSLGPGDFAHRANKARDLFRGRIGGEIIPPDFS